MKRRSLGSSFDSWLREEGIYEEVTSTAIKRVLARQLEAAMKEKNVSRTEMARQMRTSRAALKRPAPLRLPASCSARPTCWHSHMRIRRRRGHILKGRCWKCRERRVNGSVLPGTSQVMFLDLKNRHFGGILKRQGGHCA